MDSVLCLKAPTTYETQVLKIKSHGFIVDDEKNTIETLKSNNYYRLSAYFLPFKDKQKKNVHIDQVISIYNFDSIMRLWLFGVIEDIEQNVKTQVAYHLAHTYGAEAYLGKNIFTEKHDHIRFLKDIKKYKKRNHKTLILKHHNEVYNERLPIWVIIEFFTMSALSILFTDLRPQDKSIIVEKAFNTGFKHLESWLRTLAELRNKCAHFERLYY